MSQKFEIQGFQYGTESKRIKSIFEDKGKSGTRFGHLFITSSSSYFFNKADLKLYFFSFISSTEN